MIRQESKKLTSEHLRAARGLLRWDQTDLAEASGVSLPTIKRMEKQFGLLKAHEPTLQALFRALEEAGIQLIHESEEGGIGVRLRHRSGDAGAGPSQGTFEVSR